MKGQKAKDISAGKEILGRNSMNRESHSNFTCRRIFIDWWGKGVPMKSKI